MDRFIRCFSPSSPRASMSPSLPQKKSIGPSWWCAWQTSRREVQSEGNDVFSNLSLEVQWKKTSKTLWQSRNFQLTSKMEVPSDHRPPGIVSVEACQIIADERYEGMQLSSRIQGTAESFRPSDLSLGGSLGRSLQRMDPQWVARRTLSRASVIYRLLKPLCFPQSFHANRYREERHDELHGDEGFNEGFFFLRNAGPGLVVFGFWCNNACIRHLVYVLLYTNRQVIVW